MLFENDIKTLNMKNNNREKQKKSICSYVRLPFFIFTDCEICGRVGIYRSSRIPFSRFLKNIPVSRKKVDVHVYYVGDRRGSAR